MYQAAAAHLTSDGVFCQWLPLYQLTREEFALIARTFLTVFPVTTLWRADFYPDRPVIGLVGQLVPRPLDLRRVGDRLERLPAWSRDPLLATPRGLALLYAGDLGAATDLLPGETINTDDRPLLEFSAPRLTRINAAGDKDWFIGEALAEFVDARRGARRQRAGSVGPVRGRTARRAPCRPRAVPLCAGRAAQGRACRRGELEAEVRRLVPEVVAGSEVGRRRRQPRRCAPRADRTAERAGAGARAARSDRAPPRRADAPRKCGSVMRRALLVGAAMALCFGCVKPPPPPPASVHTIAVFPARNRTADELLISGGTILEKYVFHTARLTVPDVLAAEARTVLERAGYTLVSPELVEGATDGQAPASAADAAAVAVKHALPGEVLYIDLRQWTPDLTYGPSSIIVSLRIDLLDSATGRVLVERRPPAAAGADAGHHQLRRRLLGGCPVRHPADARAVRDQDRRTVGREQPDGSLAANMVDDERRRRPRRRRLCGATGRTRSCRGPQRRGSATV